MIRRWHEASFQNDHYLITDNNAELWPSPGYTSYNLWGDVTYWVLQVSRLGAQLPPAQPTCWFPLGCWAWTRQREAVATPLALGKALSFLPVGVTLDKSLKLPTLHFLKMENVGFNNAWLIGLLWSWTKGTCIIGSGKALTHQKRVLFPLIGGGYITIPSVAAWKLR